MNNQLAWEKDLSPFQRKCYRRKGIIIKKTVNLTYHNMIPILTTIMGILDKQQKEIDNLNK
jgi:hypothetical protein